MDLDFKTAADESNVKLEQNAVKTKTVGDMALKDTKQDITSKPKFVSEEHIAMATLKDKEQDFEFPDDENNDNSNNHENKTDILNDKEKCFTTPDYKVTEKIRVEETEKMTVKDEGKGGEVKTTFPDMKQKQNIDEDEIFQIFQDVQKSGRESPMLIENGQKGLQAAYFDHHEDYYVIDINDNVDQMKNNILTVDEELTLEETIVRPTKKLNSEASPEGAFVNDNRKKFTLLEMAENCRKLKNKKM